MNINAISDISSYTNMMTNNALNKKEKTFEDKINAAVTNKDNEELKKACLEFETYFIQTMYKEMRKTINYSDSVIKKSQAELTFQEMLDQENSKSLATSGGIGIANMMYKQMQNI